MKISGVFQKISGHAAPVGAGLAVLCGLLLWGTRLGEGWEIKSYDLLYRFGTHAVPTNKADVLVLAMDMNVERDTNRYALERHWHADLLDRMRADGARLAVFDVHFTANTSAESEARLAEAMRANGRVLLMANTDSKAARVDNTTLELPKTNFLAAAGGRYGVGRAEVPPYELVRRHWPRVSLANGETNFHSLGWAAAEAIGAHPDYGAEDRWLRYYGRRLPWLPYADAATQPPGFFHDKVVFVGSWPQWPGQPAEPETQKDKFSTPYTFMDGNAVGGVEINATTFLNLVAGDWLRREPVLVEFFLVVISGILLGGGLCRLRPLTALLAAIGIFFLVMGGFVVWSFYTNYWFPWLIIAGAQLPLAFAWSWAARRQSVAMFQEEFPGYKEVTGPFGEGAFGNVRVVENVTGQLQALKKVERAKFQDDSPYEREFRGVKNYKPVSLQHPGLLHVDHANRNDLKGYFFYVMELADAVDSNWREKGASYQPRDLHNVCRPLPGRRLPPRECFRVGITLLGALDFLHQRGLVHRDIKPSNIVFVADQPKLADVGLVRGAGPEVTLVGTEYYMPPPPEPPGTKAADVYALGKVLYVISTGRDVKDFPQLPADVVEHDDGFMALNEIFCRACEPLSSRFAGAAEMMAALRRAQADLDAGHTRQI